MPDKTVVIFRDKNQKEVDRFEYDHPISRKSKAAPKTFLALNYKLHEGGAPTTYNSTKVEQNIKERLEECPSRKTHKSLF